MLQYQSKRHRCLMNASEQALSDAAEGNSDSEHESRIAKQILNEPKMHRLWESQHAELVRPVAEEKKRSPQIFALRDVEVRLRHQRALIEHIRKNKIVGPNRDRLFSSFYGPRETIDAILAEHRRYMLAVSSRVSADHLINVMQDPVSTKLLQIYDAYYEKYFELYCFVATTDDRAAADATKVVMLEFRRRIKEVRKRLNSERPDPTSADFDRQELLARSGRYPILNYMVG